MDKDQGFWPKKWEDYEPGDETFPRSSKQTPKRADSYVTRREMQEFQRSIYDLMRLFLDFYLASAIEPETIRFDINYN